MSAFSIIFVQHFGEFILCDDPVTVRVLLRDHFLEFDITKTKKIDDVPTFISSIVRGLPRLTMTLISSSAQITLEQVIQLFVN